MPQLKQPVLHSFYAPEEWKCLISVTLHLRKHPSSFPVPSFFSPLWTSINSVLYTILFFFFLIKLIWLCYAFKEYTLSIFFSVKYTAPTPHHSTTPTSPVPRCSRERKREKPGSEFGRYHATHRKIPVSVSFLRTTKLPWHRAQTH